MVWHARIKSLLGIWLVLITAVFLRSYNLTTTPPGLTHDEADHGISALQIIDGERPIYFTIGYGREPLFDYATAGLMTLVSPTYFAGRLTAVYASLLLIAITYAWVRHSFDTTTALLTAAGLALSFWPQMTGRQMLRSTLLPTLFVFATYFFWKSVKVDRHSKRTLHPVLFPLLSAIFLGLTFYIYLPARIMWLIFPTVVLFGLIAQRSFFHQNWRKSFIILVIAFLITLPLLNYLRLNPTLEVRVDELSHPLNLALSGDITLLWQNIRQSLQLFTSQGDTAVRYNNPGQPWFNPIMGILFYIGLALTLWQTFRHRSPIHFFTLAWLALGIAPVLVTGPELATTQAISAQPILYLFPALALQKIRGWRLEIGDGSSDTTQHPTRITTMTNYLIAILFISLAITTYYNYFTIWGNDPDVRVQYESTMMTTMAYLNEFGDGTTAVSTITPAPEHSPALAQVTLQNHSVNLHWFDARTTLLLPNQPNSTLIIPGFTPLHPALNRYFDVTAVHHQTLPLRETDQDRPLAIYHTTITPDLLKQFTELTAVQFGDHAHLIGYNLHTPTIPAGGVLQIATLWQTQQPLPDAALFTHLLDTDGVPFAQADYLGAPGHSWQAGDYFIQLHEFIVPPETAVGTYPLTTGLYQTTTNQRLTVTQNGTIIGDHIQLTTIEITRSGD